MCTPGCGGHRLCLLLSRGNLRERTWYRGRAAHGGSLQSNAPLPHRSEHAHIYKNSELYQEILAGNWEEETEIEKYQEIKALVEGLEIPVEFAMLGASNPVMLQGRLLKQRAQIVATLDRVIEEIGEDKLRLYRTNLKHL